MRGEREDEMRLSFSFRSTPEDKHGRHLYMPTPGGSITYTPPHSAQKLYFRPIPFLSLKRRSIFFQGRCEACGHKFKQRRLLASYTLARNARTTRPNEVNQRKGQLRNGENTEMRSPTDHPWCFLPALILLR